MQVVGEKQVQLEVVMAQAPAAEHQQQRPSTSDFAADAAGTCVKANSLVQGSAIFGMPGKQHCFWLQLFLVDSHCQLLPGLLPGVSLVMHNASAESKQTLKAAATCSEESWVSTSAHLASDMQQHVAAR